MKHGLTKNIMRFINQIHRKLVTIEIIILVAWLKDKSNTFN
jgi:hypothetical protein